MTEQEFKESIDNEVKGAEKAVSTMLLYYVSALQSVGVEDVKQYIATQIGSMICLSEEQYIFVTENLKQEGKLFENINNSIRLLKQIEDKKELDLDSIKIVRQVLELILKECNEYKL
jgi:hypothetical protein